MKINYVRLYNFIYFVDVGLPGLPISTKSISEDTCENQHARFVKTDQVIYLMAAEIRCAHGRLFHRKVISQSGGPVMDVVNAVKTLVLHRV